VILPQRCKHENHKKDEKKLVFKKGSTLHKKRDDDGPYKKRPPANTGIRKKIEDFVILGSGVRWGGEENTKT